MLSLYKMIGWSRRWSYHEINEAFEFRVFAVQVHSCFGADHILMIVCPWCLSVLVKAKGQLEFSVRPKKTFHKPQAREGYEKQIPNKEMLSEKQQQQIKTHPQKTQRNKPKNLLITAKVLKITSSQTFISKVVFHVKWKYLLKPYVHICMIQTATTVQHIGLNFNKCTLTFSSKSNIVTVAPHLLWSFPMKLQSILFKVIIIIKNETDSVLWLKPTYWFLPENWTNQCRSLGTFAWKIWSCNVNMYSYSNMYYTPYFEILHINRDAA